MRTAALTGLFVVIGYAATAQLTLLPQVGFENSKTNITVNDLATFSPLGLKFSPQVGFKLDYKFKQGHGPWIGVNTSRSKVNFAFSDPENASTSYLASVGNMQLRIEAGYQHSFKPINFKNNSSSSSSKSKASSSSSKTKSPSQQTYTYRKTCGGKEVVVVRSECAQKVAKSHCGSNKTAAKKENSWMKIQPSLGVAYIPSVEQDVVTKTGNGQTVHEYHAGNWNTAFLAGTGFEFGRGKARLFTVSINYYKGLGNLEPTTVTTVSGTKTTHTTLESQSSGFSMKVGIPFTLTKNKQAKTKTQSTKKECGQKKTEYRCGQKIRI